PVAAGPSEKSGYRGVIAIGVQDDVMLLTNSWDGLFDAAYLVGDRRRGGFLRRRHLPPADRDFARPAGDRYRAGHRLRDAAPVARRGGPCLSCLQSRKSYRLGA